MNITFSFGEIVKLLVLWKVLEIILVCVTRLPDFIKIFMDAYDRMQEIKVRSEVGKSLGIDKELKGEFEDFLKQRKKSTRKILGFQSTVINEKSS